MSLTTAVKESTSGIHAQAEWPLEAPQSLPTVAAAVVVAAVTAAIAVATAVDADPKAAAGTDAEFGGPVNAAEDV